MISNKRLDQLKFESTVIASYDPDGPHGEGGFTLKHVQNRANEILELVAEVQRLNVQLDIVRAAVREPETS